MFANMRAAIILVYIFMVLPGPSYTADSLGLLAGTLKTIQRAACYDEDVSLSCAKGTYISIQVAQYGKASPGGYNCKTEPQNVSDVEKCLRPTAMQYSILQTVVVACQKKPSCKFSTKLKPGTADPCPHARNFVEVAFKCRPHEFRSRTACEDDIIKLSCSPYSRLAIYEAHYGRIAYEAHSMTCPQAQGVVDESCTAPYALETVMQICHGKRRCLVVANRKTFGSPCNPTSRPYLKIAYACVPLGVLIERYESPAEKDEVIHTQVMNQDEGLFDDSDTGEHWDGNVATPIADPALQPPSDDIHLLLEKEKASEATAGSVNRTGRSKANENLYFYVGVAISIFLILTLCLIIVRFYINHKRKRNAKNGNMFTTEAPNIFSDATSDIDNDVSHISGNFYDPGHPDMLYRESTRTLRPMKPLSTVYPTAGASMYGVDYVPPLEPLRFESDPEVMMSPKSLNGYTNTEFHYG
ncbi:protein eva-1-like [Pieris rapae]|uniref:protein eva-1-like n=1 Tax=Pieris rapae TaxID=64459 RepID=UPI001E27F26A|nr:protein eva-1-like [Pieris rapae]